jgi:deoxycytidylate deaminase
MDCARAIVQAGIVRVVIKKDWLDDKPGYRERWGEAFQKTKQLFSEANISLQEV